MSRKTNRPVGALAIAAMVTALAAPTATAVPTDQFLPGATDTRDDRGVPVRVVEVPSDRGFDWGDAGIGATGVLALAVMGVGAAVASGHRVRRFGLS